MSRHHVPCHGPYRLAVVGWDNPMRTYFAQLYRSDTPDNEDDSPHESIGYEYGEVPEPGALLEWMRDRGFNLFEMLPQLLAERDGSGPRAPAQIAVEEIITGRRAPDHP